MKLRLELIESKITLTHLVRFEASFDSLISVLLIISEQHYVNVQMFEMFFIPRGGYSDSPVVPIVAGLVRFTVDICGTVMFVA